MKNENIYDKHDEKKEKKESWTSQEQEIFIEMNTHEINIWELTETMKTLYGKLVTPDKEHNELQRRPGAQYATYKPPNHNPDVRTQQQTPPRPPAATDANMAQ
ncbi:hypothetical protein FQA39_LY03860 [Lamprigera yunnana]|nr:hypothetical protein FQA39_LY03860 [Lamprigera yunnana]